MIAFDTLLGFMEKVAKDDGVFGGQELLESAKSLHAEIVDQSSGSDTLLQKQWVSLIAHVLHHYEFERQLQENGLFIQEPRPRKFFTILPDDQAGAWKKGEAEGIYVRYREIVNDNKFTKGRTPRLSVVLPIREGYRRTSQALTCLAEDVRDEKSLTCDWPITFHICVNFTDDDSLYDVTRFARTLARRYQVDVFQYLAEDERRKGTVGSPDWSKTKILNLILQQIEASCPVNDKSCHYLHFADDDIYIPPGQCAIARNIGELDGNPNALVVSATYFSNETHAFSAISSARRRLQFRYGDSKRRLMNIYGGCMTTTRSRLNDLLGGTLQFPSSNKPSGEDPLITYRGNWDLINGEGGFNEEDLRVYALADNLVIHPEPKSVVEYIRRVLRDHDWGRSALHRLVSSQQDSALNFTKEKLIERAQEFRKSSFLIEQPQPIEEYDDERMVAEILADKWCKKIRDSIPKEPNRQRRSALENLRSFPRSRQMTQFHVCQDIVRNSEIFEEVLRSAEKGLLGYELIKLMRAARSNLASSFPEICRRLLEIPRKTILPTLIQNRYLFHLYTIAEEAVAMVAQFTQATGAPGNLHFFGRRAPTEHHFRELKQKYRFNLAELIEAITFDSGRPGHSAEDLCGGTCSEEGSAYECTFITGDKDVPNTKSFSAFLNRRIEPGKTESTEGEFAKTWDRLFIRYFPVIGVREFQDLSPRRKVYLHILGKKLVEPFWTDVNRSNSKEKGKTHLRLVRTLYPSLEQATVNYLGPQREDPFQRFLQSIWVEESLQGMTAPFARTLMSDGTANRVACCLGNALGRLHGGTIAIRKDLEAGLTCTSTSDEDSADNSPKQAINYKPGVKSLLIGHLDQVRVFESKRYADWVKAGANRKEEIQALFNAQRGQVLTEVHRLLNPAHWSLEEIWRRVCEESIEVHREHGVLGHLGIFRSNLRIGKRSDSWEEIELADGKTLWRIHKGESVDEIYIAMHAGIAMVDPALEASLVLASLMAARLGVSALRLKASDELDLQFDDSYSLDDLSLIAMQRKFCEEYSTGFQSAEQDIDLMSGPERQRFLSRWEDRVREFTAIFLLAQVHERLEFDLSQHEREYAIRICVDLLNPTIGSVLRFQHY